MTSLASNESRTRSSPLPVPVGGPTVCRVCRGPVRTGSANCWCCRKICNDLAISPDCVPPIVPMGLYRPGDQWNAVLRRYKDAPVGAARRYFANLIRLRIEQYLSIHGRCLVRETKGFDAYCVVPSSQVGRAVVVPHPLEAVLGCVRAMRSFGVVRLSAGDMAAGHLKPNETAFAPRDTADVSGVRILVVDDSWITGARALSAVATLGAAGATVSGVFVLGRAINPSASTYSRLWWAAQARPALGAPRNERCCMQECLVAPARG